MKNLYLHQHLGLGDHIICNALTRSFLNSYEKINLFVYEHNMKSVSFMYRDTDKIQCLPVKYSQNWGEHIRFIESYKALFLYDDHIRIGYEYLNNCKLEFDEAFYEQVNLPFQKRFSDFYVERDYENEMKLFNKLSLKKQEYIFISNLASNGRYDIDLRTNYPDVQKIYLDKLTDNMFDWLFIAENALEIHSIDSAFKLMIDSFSLNNYLYFYMPKGRASGIPSTQNNWKLI